MKKEFLPIFLKAAIPSFDWILSDMEKSDGWMNLPQPLIDNLLRLNLQWWKAYEDENLFKIYRALMFVDIKTLKGIKTPEERVLLKESLENEAYQYLQSDEYKELQRVEPYTEEEKKEISDFINNLLTEATEEERIEFWRDISFHWLGFFTSFFDLLALMIHGKSMRQLVHEAKEGDDESFLQAMQTDRMVLFLPYFQERIMRAQLGKDIDFIDKLGYRIKNPLVRSKMRRRTLWLFFALLESEDMLDMSGPKLMALCKEVGVYGDEYGTGNLRTLHKRRKDYYNNRGTRKYF